LNTLLKRIFVENENRTSDELRVQKWFEFLRNIVTLKKNSLLFLSLISSGGAAWGLCLACLVFFSASGTL